jgi:hypothetical protein
MGHAFTMVVGIAVCVLTLMLSHWVHDKMRMPSQQYAAQAESFGR